ncbi:MAG: DNA translocase FtsK [Solirubrobacterales bacterium]|nr:DNA translocase FtsK [Solirubrobacterales bacterium]
MATRAARKPPRKRARRSLLARTRPSVPRLQLAAHHVDIIALALLALGIFLVCVAYAGLNGGALGSALVVALRFLLGVIGYAVPAALLVAGGLVLSRELHVPGRPLRAGALCLSAGLTLAMAAGTLGVGPGPISSHTFWRPQAFEARGGVVGQGELWLAGHLVSTLGAQILALFLLLAGVMLSSGVTFAGALRATRAGAGRATRVLARSSEQLAGSHSLQRAAARLSRADAEASRGEAAVPAVSGVDPGQRQTLLPPEPDTDELVVRATHVEAPPPRAMDEGADLSHEGASASDGRSGGGTGGEGASAQAAGDQSAQLTPQGRFRAAITDDPSFQWRVPSSRFLVRSGGDAARPDTAGQEQVARTLIETLGHFGIDATVVGRVTGPHITRYELRLAPGTKVSKVAQLKDDLAYSLAATEIRILAPIPGKQAVGVEVPNARRRIVHLGDVFQHPPPDWSPLAVWLGKDIAGRAIGADLAKMPHLLVAGTTGSGKSASVNAMLASILLRATPHEVRFVLVDPKQVELNHYESIPHLLTPVITSPRMAANALQNLVKEMDQRYGMMSLARTRSLPELNRARERRGEPSLPYVLCVIDELADLMMVAPADVEDSVIRLAQKARAVGIHLVLATQSPRVDVITGMIKANVPSRIAFAVSSQTDSRVILDHNGAESLLGQGDMLFSPLGSSKLQRIQGAFIGEAEIAELSDAWRHQGEPQFSEELLQEVEPIEGEAAEEEAFHPDEDPLLEEAIALVAQMGTASTSMLQRRLRLGYTRAGRLIDMLERRGVISGYEGSKPRQVLISEADVPRILAHLSHDADSESGGVPEE